MWLRIKSKIITISKTYVFSQIIPDITEIFLFCEEIIRWCILLEGGHCQRYWHLAVLWLRIKSKIITVSKSEWVNWLRFLLQIGQKKWIVKTVNFTKPLTIANNVLL